LANNGLVHKGLRLIWYIGVKNMNNGYQKWKAIQRD